jgi:hypothetical protein
LGSDAHEQTLAHLRLLAGLPGYWELRALCRKGGNPMIPRGSFWIVATTTADGLLYERLDQALAWADRHDRQGTELFVGVNARSMEGKTKAAVPAVTACFVDLDLGGEGTDEALADLMSGTTPTPSFVVNSGYGLHAIWLLREPSRDKARWRVIQQALVRAFAHYGADPACAPDSASATGADTGARVRLCTERQRQAIRSLLRRAGQTEDWLLAKLHLEHLDDVPYARAEQVIGRLGELARDQSNAQP